MGADVAKGVFSGVIWGAVVAGAGAGGLSLAYPEFKPSMTAIPASALVSEAGMDEGTSDSASESAGESVPQDAAMAAEADAQMSDATTGEAVEETSADASSMQDEGATSGEPTPDAEIATADQPMTETPGAMAADADAAEPSPDEMPDAMAQDEITGESPASDETMSTGAAQQDQQPGAMAASDTVDANADATENEQTDATAVEAGTISTGADTAQTEPDTIEDPATSITEDIIAALPRATAPDPQGTLGNLAEGVTTGRLPSVASGTGENEDTDTATAVETPEPPKPIIQFAQPVEADDGRPLMSIVLIDEGDSDLGLEALEAFPYPLTFAVDASAPDAAARMQRYRDKGFEVLALVSLPGGATPSDAEVAMSAYLSAVPEAVGILEDPGASLQESRELSDQVTEIIQNSGHGMVLQAKGLNTAQKLAKREGIPAASVFRDFDGKDQKAGVIRRFLDQAAFKAGQEGGVIMLGRLRGETISALLIWGLADRASRVALVPVSAVLTQTPDDS